MNLKIRSIVAFALIIIGLFNCKLGYGQCALGQHSNSGFQTTLSCAVKSQTYIEVVPFKIPTSAGSFNVQYMIIDSITNLPAGITATVNKGFGAQYAAGENGCVTFSGVTNAAAGQYRLGIFGKLKVTVIPVALSGDFFTISNYQGVDSAEQFVLWSRLKDNASSPCPCIDTSRTTLNDIKLYNGTEPDCPSASSMSASAITTSPGCNGSNVGSIEVMVSGGVPPYTHKIDNQPYQSSNTFSGLSVGSYVVWVKDSTNSDSLSIAVNITQSTTAPAPVEICMVSVDSATGYNVVVWEKPVATHIDSFVILKETNQANVYATIGKKGYNEFSTFIDVNSNSAVQAYRYKLAVIDSCGTLSDPSQFHKTIHLTSTLGLGGSVNLIWSHYEGVATVTYNIYRGTSPQNMQLLTTIASNLNSYTDLTPPPGAFYYFIEIVFSGCNPTARQYERVRSNIINTAETTSITQIEGVSSLNIAPNPSNGKFVLNIETKEEIDGKVSVTDVTGRIMIDEHVKLPIGTNNLEYNLPISGYYFVSFQSKDRLKVQPIIVAR